MKTNNKNNSETETQLLSQLAYAKARGCSHSAVAKAIKSGRLSRSLHRDEAGKIRIDPAVANLEWEANTNEAKRTNVKAESIVTSAASVISESRARAESLVPAESLHISVSLPGTVDDIEDTTSFKDARAMKEHYLALLAQLDYEVKSGKLLDANEAKQTAFGASRKARDMLLTVADRLAPVVAGITDQFECHVAITTEIRRVCDELHESPLGE